MPDRGVVRSRHRTGLDDASQLAFSGTTGLAFGSVFAAAHVAVVGTVPGAGLLTAGGAVGMVVVVVLAAPGPLWDALVGALAVEESSRAGTGGTSRSRGGRSGGGRSGRPSDGSTGQVLLEPRDPDGTPHEGEVHVRAAAMHGDELEEGSFSSKRGRLELSPGQWQITASSDAGDVSKRVTVQRGGEQTVRLPFSGHDRDSAAARSPDPVPVVLEARDAEGQLYDGPIDVEFDAVDAPDGERREVSFTGGRDDVELAPGEWRLSASTADGGDSRRITITPDADLTIAFDIPTDPSGPTLDVLVESADGGDVSGADVTVHTSGGDVRTAETGLGGTCSVELPPGTARATVEVDAGEDGSASRTVRVDSDRVRQAVEVAPDVAPLIERARGHVADAKRPRDRGDHGRAVAALERAIETYERASDLAADHASEYADDVATELAEAEDQRTVVHRERLRSRLEELRNRVTDAEISLEEGAGEAAAGGFEAVLAALEDLVDDAADHGVTAIDDDVAALRERCETGLAAATDASRSGPPDEIPRAPNIDVVYDALDRDDPVGRGGNADVYRVTVSSADGDHEVALKEPRFDGTLHTGVVDRFLAEAETWSKLDDHDHVVDVVNWGSDPLPWFAVEYMDAGGLDERVGDVDPRKGVWIAAVIADAVLHAHRAGYSHLDLKPSNILFRSTPGDDWAVPKVADWGPAKLLLDHSKSMAGLTVHYAAPEQIDDDYGSVGHATDVYQLGATFYELFTGRPPHTGEAVRVVRKIVDEPVTPPTEIVDALPGRLDDILLKALATEQADRFDDVAFLQADLQELFESL